MEAEAPTQALQREGERVWVLEGARDEYLRLRAIAARARRVFWKDYE